MSGWLKLILLAAGLTIPGTAAAEAPFGLGRVAAPEEIAGWDIDVRPDGVGAPPGSGSVRDGEDIYMQRCASCHGDFGEAFGRWPALMGGDGSLASNEPDKTVGSYWPYASTLFDYIYRAMPFGDAQSLTHDETYAVTAYVLYLNFLVDEDFVLTDENLADIEMPNVDGFYVMEEPEFPPHEPCMQDCKDEVRVVGRAQVLDVTPGPPASDVEPEGQEAGPDSGDQVAVAALEGDPAAGERVFRRCQTCHTVEEGGAQRLGPNLWSIFGREAGAHPGFTYSAAMAESELVWTGETLKEFLRDPRGFLPGNRMAFPGLRDQDDLDDIVAFLRENSDAQ
jgi:S-disulfanyl-L-cysteine oxidoreductase SoxD